MTATECEKRISQARTFLTARCPFLGYLTLKLKPVACQASDGVPTIGVARDGTLVYNEEWISNLSDRELRGVLAHEVLHPALGVFERQHGREMRLWNDAHDYAINLILADFFRSDGMRDNAILPQGGLLDSRFERMSTEEIYDVLLAERENEEKKGMKGSDDEEGGEGEGSPNGKGPRSFRGDVRPDLSSSEEGQKAARGDASSKRRLREDWEAGVVAAAQIHARSSARGDLPYGVKLLIDEIIDPKVPWAKIISHWLGEHAGDPDLTYLRPGRRSEAVGERLIGSKRSLFPEVTVLWDTSGSMGGLEKDIFSEIQGICEDLDLGIRVIIIDAAIHADLEDVQEAQEIAASVKGGGGSDFNPAFHRLDEERNTSVVIAFTDGYIGVPSVQPESLKGVVWVLVGGQHDPTGGVWGQVLILDKEKNGKWA